MTSTHVHSRSARLLALTLYLVLLGLAASWLLARGARAALTEQTSALGRRLGAFGELGGSTTELTLNGQRFAFSARTFELPHTELVERFVTACDDHTKPLADALADELPRAGAEGSPLLRSLLAPHAFASDGTASAVCLVGLANGGVRGLAARARAFVHTRDLGALGQLRFAFVRPLGPRRAQLLLVTADGGLALDALLPRGDTDVPGGDVLSARPDGGVRTLSAEVHGTPHGISVYRVADGPRAALRSYDARLTALGYTRVVSLTPDEGGGAQEGARPFWSETVRRGADAYVITASPAQLGSLVSVVRLGHARVGSPFDRDTPDAVLDPALR